MNLGVGRQVSRAHVDVVHTDGKAVHDTHFDSSARHFAGLLRATAVHEPLFLRHGDMHAAQRPCGRISAACGPTRAHESRWSWQDAPRRSPPTAPVVALGF